MKTSDLVHDAETILSGALGMLAALESAVQCGASDELLATLTGRLTGELLLARSYCQTLRIGKEDNLTP